MIDYKAWYIATEEGLDFPYTSLNLSNNCKYKILGVKISARVVWASCSVHSIDTETFITMNSFQLKHLVPLNGETISIKRESIYEEEK